MRHFSELRRFVSLSPVRASSARGDSTHRVLFVASAVAAGLIALFAMAPAGANAVPSGGISGKVTDTEGHPISGANVCLYAENETLVKCEVFMEPSGAYKFENLAAAKYRVGFNAGGFATQYYKGASSLSEATLVEVMTSVVPNINAELQEVGEGEVAGRVTNASTGQGAGGVEVCSDEFNRPCAETNGNGEYTLSNLSVGSHEIYFSPAEACEEEQGEKIRCQAKSNYLKSQANSIRVKAGQTTTVDAALQVGGQISGIVTNVSITHPGLAKVKVCATRVTGPEESGGEVCGFTGFNGQYTINGLENGFYKIKFGGKICTVVKKDEEECPEVYITQYYHGQQTFKKGITTTVTTGSNTSGINESLYEAFPTTPSATAAPTLTGTPAVGDALTCSQGSWAHEPTYLLYQWTRNGTIIAGQTGSTYTLQAADQGHSIACSVTAGNGAGATIAASNAVAIPVPLSLFAGVKVKGPYASVALRCPGPGACSGVMRIVARVTTGRGKRRKTTSITIGVASFSMAAGKRVTLHVLLTGQGRKLLAKAGRLGLKVQIAGTGVQAHAAKLKSPAPKKRR